MLLLKSSVRIKLYEKIGFRAVGSVEMKGDKFTIILGIPGGICEIAQSQ